MSYRRNGMMALRIAITAAAIKSMMLSSSFVRLTILSEVDFCSDTCEFSCEIGLITC